MGGATCSQIPGNLNSAIAIPRSPVSKAVCSYQGICLAGFRILMPLELPGGHVAKFVFEGKDLIFNLVFFLTLRFQK